MINRRIKARIRKALDSDLADVRRIHAVAFGRNDESQLVEDILHDPSARPALSLIATGDAAPLGHILFSAARLSAPGPRASLVLLAPLAVVPGSQGHGIGGALIAEGARRLAAAGVDLIFVLGDPRYYGRHGFEPAGERGFAAPYPLPEAYEDGWMVRALRSGVIGTVRGKKVVCADALDKPEYWRE